MKQLGERVVQELRLGDYKGESVIVNFYKKNDYMGGHLDDGEPD